MSPEEIKLECIKLAHSKALPFEQSINMAEKYADFIFSTEHAKMRERLKDVEKAIQKS